MHFSVALRAARTAQDQGIHSHCLHSPSQNMKTVELQQFQSLHLLAFVICSVFVCAVPPRSKQLHCEQCFGSKEQAVGAVMWEQRAHSMSIVVQARNKQCEQLWEEGASSCEQCCGNIE